MSFIFTGMLILEKKIELVIVTYLNAVIVMPTLCYILAVKYKMNLPGVWVAFLVEMCVSNLIFILILSISKWKKIKGINDE